MPNKSDLQKVVTDDQDLRARLEKAEESLREILSGEADALFVSGQGGAQLFALKGADQSYRTLIENMSEGALTLTSTGLILYANRRFAEMLRTPLEKVIGSHIHTWFAPASRQVVQTLLRKDAVDNRREELALAAADGTQVPVNLSVSHLILDGMPDSFCMVATDLTEQKRNEAILAADKLARAILEQAADAIAICDETGRILRASKHAQAICGIDPVGQHFEHAFPLRQPDGTAFSPIGAIDTSRRQSVEARLERGGQGFDLLVSVGHLKSPRDELLGSVVTLTDITERKTHELALQKSERQLSEALTIAKIGYWEYEYSTDQFIFNDQYYLLHKITAEEAGGYRMSSADFASRYVYPEDAPVVGHNVRLAFDSLDPDFFAKTEVRILAGDGEIIWVEVRMRIQKDLQGNTIRLFGVNQDITERKHAEQSLRESERRFSELLGNVELISVMRDREERITYCNEYLLRLTGWQYEEILGRNWVEVFVPPEIADGKKKIFAALLLNKPEALHHESEILTRSGERRLIRWSNTVLRSGTGEVIGTASIGEDITDRNRLELEKEQYLKFFMLSTNAMCIADPYGCFKKVNPAFIQLTGYSEGELLAKPFLDFVHPEDRQRTMDEMKLEVEVRPTLHFENRYVRHDGTVIRLSWTAYYDRLDGVTYATADDITERKEAEARIAFLNRVYAVLSGINTLIVRVRSRDELFGEACRIAVEAGGFRIALIAIVDRSAMKIVPVASAGKDEALLTAIKGILSSTEDAPKTMVARALREKKAIVSNSSQSDRQVLFGEQYAESGVRSMAVLPLLVADEAVGALALYASEIDFFQEEELKLLTELTGDIAFAVDHIDKQVRLDYLAYYDELTGLANRTLFLERVAQYLRSAAEGHKLALYMIDLERFRNINDSLGRLAGDALLRQVAEWLKRNLGDANLVARLDADHFAAVLPIVKQDGDGAQLIENTMQAFMDHPFRLNDAVFRIAAKVGVAVFPDTGADADTLFRKAEAALKQAKASGERYLFYTKTMTEAVAGKLTLENQLREALDKGEFVLHYQPKVNLGSGKLTGAEALIRWNDPRTGLVPPGRFIPILEETGLIYEVGRWALRQAIADYLRWRAAGLPAVRIAVNVSPLQLRNRGFVAEIAHVIGIDAQAPAGLELEITESLIMEDVKHNIASLQAIRTMGVNIAIDDFGTGFSSLAYLAKLPVDTLKIDRSFVIDMTAAPEGLALVSTIINLAHSLKLKVVAEGVETEEQSRLLRLLACDEMQGFLFSKAVPSEIFETKFLAPLRAE